MPEDRTSAPWREVEPGLRAALDPADPYTGVDVDVEFTHADGGDVELHSADLVPAPFRIVDPGIVDPRTGEVVRDPGGAPRVHLCCGEFPEPLRPSGERS